MDNNTYGFINALQSLDNAISYMSFISATGDKFYVLNEADERVCKLINSARNALHDLQKELEN